MRTSFDPFGFYWSLVLVANLPFQNLISPILGFLSAKCTIMYTNVNAIKRNLTYIGKEFKGCFYFVPTAGLVMCGLSISTIGDYIGCGVLSDTSGINDPDEFMDIFV